MLSTTSAAAYEFLKVSTERDGTVGVVQLDRPKALNALSEGVVNEILDATKAFDDNPDVGAIVLTGSERAFAAGADIAAMQNLSFPDVYTRDFLSEFQDLMSVQKPIIAAVRGFALGGGCELMMTCDIVVAGESAQFGQPEIKLGVIPGAGGTQRLTQAVGKSKAMELCLTGDFIPAQEARDYGLVSSVVADDAVLDHALDMGAKIATYAPHVVAMIKECVNKSYEMTLAEGLHYERRMFHSLFATKAQKEGMSAFLEKRKPEWPQE